VHGHDDWQADPGRSRHRCCTAGPDTQDGAPTPSPAPTDGRFDSGTEAVTRSLSTVDLPDGRHLVCVVGSDASGAGGPVSAGWLDVGVAPPGQRDGGCPASMKGTAGRSSAALAPD
jgi:hypothetical protein